MRCFSVKALGVVLVGDGAGPSGRACRSTGPALATALHMSMVSTRTKQTTVVEMAHLAVLGCGLRRSARNEEKSTEERDRCGGNHGRSEVCRVVKRNALLP